MLLTTFFLELLLVLATWKSHFKPSLLLLPVPLPAPKLLGLPPIPLQNIKHWKMLVGQYRHYCEQSRGGMNAIRSFLILLL